MKPTRTIDRRGWLAIWLQQRRRARQRRQRPDDAPSPVPNAPVIVGGEAEWEATEPGWFDVQVQWTFVHGSFPPAQLEIWQSLDQDNYTQVATVSSLNTSYYVIQAADREATFDFKVRYRNGATLGPFSNGYRIEAVI